MKYRTEIVREGEKLGVIDWAHPFIDSFQNYCASDEQKQIYCDKSVAVLKQVTEADDPMMLQVRCDDYWYNVFDVGMYDGWPFWRPMPAVQVEDRVFHCAIWKFFYELAECRMAKAGEHGG